MMTLSADVALHRKGGHRPATLRRGTADAACHVTFTRDKQTWMRRLRCAGQRMGQPAGGGADTCNNRSGNSLIICMTGV